MTSRPVVAAVALAGLLMLGAAGVTSGQATAPPDRRRPAVTMSYRGADWLERRERDAEEQPQRVIDLLHLAPGDVAADVGCATGYFARRMAPAVAPTGTVYCVDIQPEMLEMMARLAERDGVEGIVPVLGTEDDLRLPSGAIDWIVLADVYHEMSDPVAMLAAMREALAPDGRVVLLEYRLEDGTGDAIKADHRMSVRQVMREWNAAGFDLEALQEFLPAQHLFLFRVRRPAGGPAGGVAIPAHPLLDALADGSVEARITVKDPGTVTIRARALDRPPLILTVPAGASLTGPGPTELIARRDGAVLIDGPGWHQAELRTLVRSRAAPPLDPGTPLAIGPSRLDARLGRLVQALQAGTYIRPGRTQPLFYPPQTLDVERTAIWIADANPSFEQIEPLVGSDRMSAAYVAAFALVFCDQAGIDIRTTALWGEREQLFDGLRYPPLRVWYEDMRER